MLFGIGFFLLLAGVFQVFRPCKADKGSTAEGGTTGTPDEKGITKLWTRIKACFKGRPIASSEGSLLTVGFSVLVLAWAMLLVAERPQVSPPCLSHCTSQIVAEPRLPALKFRRGDWGKPDFNGLEKALKPETGDTLLLIGSADCTPSRTPGNTTLASNRASTVRERLKHEHSDLEFQTIVLPQYDDCKETPSLRAVFPYLIRSKSTER